ncbi:catabolite control protein A [Clostridia bacterium]|nr:catabolite control protein A [Clostridia bacterium]
MATLYEIAREANVSPSTAARALRGDGYCSQDKLLRVQEAASRLNYVRSHAARSLKNKRTDKILFCIPDIYNPFYFRMIKGADDVLRNEGYYVVLCHTHGELETERNMLRNLGEGYGDAMIFVSFDFNADNIGWIAASGKPVVITNRYDDGSGANQFDSVYIDTYEGVRIAARHFLDMGESRLGYIGGSTVTQTGRERLEGFKQAMIECGIPTRQEYLFEGDFSRESGELRMREMIERDCIPRAIVAANDLMAVGALKVCERAGLQVPRDVAIIGMDNTDLALSTTPELSSVIMREEEIGRLSAELLLERLKSGRKDGRTIRLEPQLALRDSSKLA